MNVIINTDLSIQSEEVPGRGGAECVWTGGAHPSPTGNLRSL